VVLHESVSRETLCCNYSKQRFSDVRNADTPVCLEARNVEANGSLKVFHVKHLGYKKSLLFFKSPFHCVVCHQKTRYDNLSVSRETPRQRSGQFLLRTEESGISMRSFLLRWTAKWIASHTPSKLSQTTVSGNRSSSISSISK